MANKCIRRCFNYSGLNLNIRTASSECPCLCRGSAWGSRALAQVLAPSAQASVGAVRSPQPAPSAANAIKQLLKDKPERVGVKVGVCGLSFLF